MICYNTPPKYGVQNGEDTLELSVRLVFGKCSNGRWIYHCIVAENDEEYNVGTILADHLEKVGVIKEISNLLYKIKTPEAKANKRATVYCFFDAVTKESRVSISYQKERVDEFQAWAYGYVKE